MSKTYSPGEIAPFSGQYQIIDTDGKGGKERTVVKNEPFPPTERPGQKYRLVDRTNNNAGGR